MGPRARADQIIRFVDTIVFKQRLVSAAVSSVPVPLSTDAASLEQEITERRIKAANIAEPILLYIRLAPSI